MELYYCMVRILSIVSLKDIQYHLKMDKWYRMVQNHLKINKIKYYDSLKTQEAITNRPTKERKGNHFKISHTMQKKRKNRNKEQM